MTGLPTIGEARTEAQRRIAVFQSSDDVTLDLSGLGLTAWPAEVFKLQGLEELRLSNNRIEHLP